MPIPPHERFHRRSLPEEEPTHGEIMEKLDRIEETLRRLEEKV